MTSHPDAFSQEALSAYADVVRQGDAIYQQEKNDIQDRRAIRTFVDLFRGLAALAPPEAKLWRCFHCDEVFTDRAEASLHFGDHLQGDPACKLNAMEGGLLKLVRDQEDELQRFRSEETASFREFYALGAEHMQRLQREEETGYARGLTAGRAEAVQPIVEALKTRAKDMRKRSSGADTDPKLEEFAAEVLDGIVKDIERRA